jgi:hypothetical protein
MSFIGLSQPFLIGMGTGCVGFALSIAGMQAIVSQYFQNLNQKVTNLPKAKDKYFFWTLGPSTVHAIVQIIGTAGFLRPLLAKSVVSQDSSLFVDYGWTGLGPEIYQGIFVGYLLADFAYLGPKMLGPAYVGHHLMASACWIYSSLSGINQWLAALLQFNEFSTIFMNLRQLLLTSGYSSSSSEVTIISLLFFLSFGAVRVAPLFLVLKNWISSDFGIVRDEVGMLPAAITSGFIIFHCFLQGYWFSLMLKKLAGKFLSAKGDTKKE